MPRGLDSYVGRAGGRRTGNWSGFSFFHPGGSPASLEGGLTGKFSNSPLNTYSGTSGTRLNPISLAVGPNSQYRPGQYVTGPWGMGRVDDYGPRVSNIDVAVSGPAASWARTGYNPRTFAGQNAGDTRGGVGPQSPFGGAFPSFGGYGQMPSYGLPISGPTMLPTNWTNNNTGSPGTYAPVAITPGGGGGGGPYGLGGGGFNPLAGAGMGTPGMGGSLGPTSGWLGSSTGDYRRLTGMGPHA